jgi:hypothetical protein
LVQESSGIRECNSGLADCGSGDAIGRTGARAYGEAQQESDGIQAVADRGARIGRKPGQAFDQARKGIAVFLDVRLG